MIDSIEKNIMQTKDYVEKAHKKLVSGKVYHEKEKKKKCCCILCILIAFAIILFWLF